MAPYQTAYGPTSEKGGDSVLFFFFFLKRFSAKI